MSIGSMAIHTWSVDVFRLFSQDQSDWPDTEKPGYFLGSNPGERPSGGPERGDGAERLITDMDRTTAGIFRTIGLPDSAALDSANRARVRENAESDTRKLARSHQHPGRRHATEP
jgi:hypothetical protein